MVRFFLVILVLVLSVTNQGFRDETATGDDVAPIAGPEIRPLDFVTSSVSRGVVGLRSPQASVAQLLEQMQAEPSRRPQFPDALADAMITEPETSARGRLAAGLLLGAAAHARSGR